MWYVVIQYNCNQAYADRLRNQITIVLHLHMYC